jgi:hypothetical protein
LKTASLLSDGLPERASEIAQTEISLLSHPFRRKTRKGWGTEVLQQMQKHSGDCFCADFYLLSGDPGRIGMMGALLPGGSRWR